MTTLLYEDAEVQIPGWVVDHKSFRRWIGTDEFPEQGRICFLNGEVWVDMSGEELFSHNQVKTEFTAVLYGLVKSKKLGRYCGDGMLLSNVPANITAGPDGVFFTHERRRTGRLRLRKSEKKGYIELVGAPDMVLEVVSPSSVKKDTVILRQAYWECGIPEYWLVDARRDPLRFDILRRSRRGYVAARTVEGWVRSNVFTKEFRFTQQTDDSGEPEYSLDVR